MNGPSRTLIRCYPPPFDNLRANGQLFVRVSFGQLRAALSPTHHSTPSVYKHALFEVDHAARLVGGLRVVRHHEDRLVELAVQAVEQAEDFLSRRAVEIAG